MRSKKLIDLIEKGIKLSYLKMLEEKSRNNEVLIFSENGKIIHLMAKDALIQLKKKGIY